MKTGLTIVRGQAFARHAAPDRSVAACTRGARSCNPVGHRRFAGGGAEGGRSRRPCLRHQHRLRQARQDAHRARSAGAVADQSRSLARGRHRPIARRCDCASRSGAQGRKPRARLFRRPARSDRRADGALQRRRPAVDSFARIGRRLRRSRAAGAHDAGADGRGRSAHRRHGGGGKRRLAPRGSSAPCRSPPRRGWRC